MRKIYQTGVDLFLTWRGRGKSLSRYKGFDDFVMGHPSPKSD